jgi:hypothetical protein
VRVITRGMDEYRPAVARSGRREWPGMVSGRCATIGAELRAVQGHSAAPDHRTIYPRQQRMVRERE